MKRINNKEFLQLLSRVWSGPTKELSGKQAEEKMTNLLKEKLPKAESIEVTDISGKINNYMLNYFFFKFEFFCFNFEWSFIEIDCLQEAAEQCLKCTCVRRNLKD